MIETYRATTQTAQPAGSVPRELVPEDMLEAIRPWGRKRAPPRSGR